MKQIQWYPGHMKKTKRLLQENMRLVDVIIEFADARIPKSSVNPDFDEILKQKPRIIAYNKSDLADRRLTLQWKQKLTDAGNFNVFIECKTGKGIDELFTLIKKAAEPVIQKDLSKGMVNRPIKLMAVGIPNTGKSTFINRIAKNAATKTGNRPGITRGKQWVNVNKDFMVLDMPGILWPKFNDEETALNLAFTGAISDDILDLPDIAFFLLVRLEEMYPGAILKRYGFDPQKTDENLLDMVAKARGCIIKGGEPDYERAAKLVLDDFRNGRLGKITLEMP